MRLRSLAPLLVLFAACAPDDATGASDDGLTQIAFAETTVASLVDQACGTGPGRGCYTNYAVTADLDGDGVLDLVFANGGGHFVPTGAQPQAVYFGDGTGKFQNAATSFDGLAPAIVRQVAIADFDGDGRLDVYLPGGYGLTNDQLFMQLEPRTFSNQPERLGDGTAAARSTAGAVHAGDIDGDGDMDLVLADWGTHPNPDDETPASAVTVRTFTNDGAGHFTPGPVLAAPGGSTATDIDLQDVDGDFDLDLVLTNRNGQSRLYLNDGRGAFEDVTVSRAFPAKRGPFTFNAELCDVDADGDLDLLFDGGARHLANHSTQLLLNDGQGRFTDETVRIVGEPRSDDNQVKCADVDNDGDFDLVVASLTHPSEKLLRNDGSGKFELVDNVFPRLGDPTLAIDFGDFDGDGKIDLVTAQGEIVGRPWVERIFKNTGVQADAVKPRFRKIERPTAIAGQPTVLRLAVSDSHTSETGQHLKSVSLDVIVDGVAQVVPAAFVGGDIFRAVVPACKQGASIVVRPHATDRAGNEAVGAAFVLGLAP